MNWPSCFNLQSFSFFAVAVASCRPGLYGTPFNHLPKTGFEGRAKYIHILPKIFISLKKT